MCGIIYLLCLFISLMYFSALDGKHYVGKCNTSQYSSVSEGLSSDCPPIALFYDVSLSECLTLLCDLRGSATNYRHQNYTGSQPGHCNVLQCPTADLNLTLGSGGWDVYTSKETPVLQERIAFSVRPTFSNLGPVPTDLTIIFDNVVVNIGNSYSPFLGIFRAPSPGLYQFHWSLGGKSNSEPTESALYVNQTAKIGSYENYLSYSQSGNSIILDLQPGDLVEIMLRSGSRMNGELFSYFSGHLLQTHLPAFSARSTETFDVDVVDKTLVYDITEVNSGGHYNPLTGAFLAPNHGIYEFNWGATSYRNSDLQHTVLWVNFVPMAAAKENTPRSTMAVNNVVLQLNEGDVVQIVLAPGGLIQNGAAGTQTTSFSGRMHFDLSSGVDPSKVAFSAVKTSSNTASGDVLFDTVHTNLGGGYDPSTGRFTAPLPGTYKIHAALYAASPTALTYMYIRKNGSDVARARDDTYTQSSISQSLILHLTVGDYINVHVLGRCYSSTGREIFSTFSGLLLYTDE